MILSHHNRFIFVKTYKTAGTSVELSLSRYCGPNDVISRLAPDDEALRAEHELRDPQHCDQKRRVPPHRWRQRWHFGQLRRGQWPWDWRLPEHAPAHVIASEQPSDWMRYTTFSIIRNPWDAFASYYWWALHGAQGDAAPTVDELLEDRDPATGWKVVARNWPMLTIDGELAVDHVCRYEQLIPDLTAVLKRVAVDFDGWLPRAKANTERRGTSYRELLSPRQAEIIAEECAPEIEAFGYSY